MIRRAHRSLVAAACAVMGAPALAATDLHFDYTSFETGFQQPQFDVLNYPSINGNYMMTSTDNHRPEMVANNNVLAEFYNNWLADYNAQPPGAKDAAAEADKIHQYTLNNSTNNGPRPNWLVLNELSSSLWSANAGAPSLSTYRTWAIDCVTRLRDTYGYNVVALAPFQNPGANDESWVALSNVAYVGAEVYLSGTEVWNSGADNTARYNWARSQYQSSKNSYLNRGVPADKLFIIEHFANNAATYVDNQGVTRTTGWGRAGLASPADWDTVLMLRQDAIKSVGFNGFLAYNWGGNAMGITQAEQIQHEYYYRSRLVMAGQQPQWLPDNTYNVNGTTIPLSWNQPLNWIGGVPNASGTIANFFRTNTAARTITLDGAQTVGTLSFNSAASYTIAPGSGGSLIFANGGSTTSLSVVTGTHTITAPLSLIDSVNVNVATSLSLSGGLNFGTKTFTKSGAGTLTISGPQSHSNGAAFTISAGILNLNSDGGTNLTINANATTNFSATQHLKALNIGSGATATLSSGGAKVLVVSALNITSGKLQLSDNDLIVRNGSRAVIEGLVKSGFGNFNWQGTGITSSTAATFAQTDSSRALGVVNNADWGYGTFSGQTVGATDILVKFTWTGDANCDGLVNNDDFGQFLYGFNGGGIADWLNGDFDYSGVVDNDDFGLLLIGLSAFNASGGTQLSEPLRSDLSAFATVNGIPMVVPEPGALALLIGLLTLRRR